MTIQNSTEDRPLPPNIIQYDHFNPSPHFSNEQIAYIESIQKYFSDEDLERIRKLEWLRRNLNVSGMGENSIPGLRFKSGVNYLYVRRYSAEKHRTMMDKFLDYVPDVFPQDDIYKCNMPPFRITVPDGDRYYPFAFHGDLRRWRKRLFDAAAHYQTLIGRFYLGKFFLSNGQSFSFSELTVDCARARTHPADW